VKKIIIALDGPAASGKSTTARLVSRQLGYIYVDTGAMYRAVTLLFQEKGIRPAEVTENQVRLLLSETPVSLKIVDSVQHVFLGSRDVSEEIRTASVTAAVSEVAAIPSVRKEMVRLQQAMGKEKGLVMDGRDIGTVVFPDAELKVFMIADPEARAHRRKLELEGKGQTVDFDTLLMEIKHRDHLDSTREDSPLRQAEDAITLDTSHLTLDEQVAWIISKAKFFAEGSPDRLQKIN